MAEADSLTSPGSLPSRYGSVDCEVHQRTTKPMYQKSTSEHCRWSSSGHDSEKPSNMTPQETRRELLRRRKQAMALHIHINELLQGLKKDDKLKKSQKYRPSLKRSSTLNSFVSTVESADANDETALPLTPYTPHFDMFPSNLNTPANDLSSYFGVSPLMMPFGSGGDPPMFLRPISIHQNIVATATGGEAFGGDTFHGPITGANVGGRNGRNEVRNNHQDLEANRVHYDSAPQHWNHHRSHGNVMFMFSAVLLSFSGMCFLVDLDVLLAILKGLNGKGLG